MTVTYKQLLETSYVQVNSKLEELQRLISLTRGFSMKSSSHLKVLTSLVNDLNDNDDSLQLVDTDLNIVGGNVRRNHTGSRERIPPNGISEKANKSHTINVNVHERGKPTEIHTYTIDDNKSDQGIRSTIPPRNSGQSNVDNLNFERDKLFEHLNTGDKSIEFIKKSFDKLLDILQKSQTEQRSPLVGVHPASQSVYVKDPSNRRQNRKNRREFSEVGSDDSGDDLDLLLLQSVQGFK